MNRIVVATLCGLVMLVGFALCGDEAQAFGHKVSCSGHVSCAGHVEEAAGCSGHREGFFARRRAIREQRRAARHYHHASCAGEVAATSCCGE